MMTSSCGFKMALTFNGTIFLIWGRPFLESNLYNIQTVYNTWGFGEKNFLPKKKSDVSSHVTYGCGSLKKKCSEYVDKHLNQVSCFFHNLKCFSFNFHTSR